MVIVDSQVHLWSNNVPVNTAHRQMASYTADDALRDMDEAGVDAAVIHPPGWDYNSSEMAVEAALRHPTRFAVLGKFPLDTPISQSLIDDWKQQPGMLGLRFVFLQPPATDWFSDGTLDWLWAEAERAGLPVGMAAAGILPQIGLVAERHPGLKLTIDHMGRPQGKTDAEAFETLPALIALAKYPNVAVKLSGAPSYSSQPYPYLNIHDYIHEIYDAFGPERSFWGTDITRMPCSYRECVTMFTEELQWLSENEKELVMGQSLCRWLDWELPDR